MTKTPVKSVCNHYHCEDCYSKIYTCSICRSDLKKNIANTRLEKVILALKDFIVFSVDEPEYACAQVLINIANLLLLHPEFDIDDIENSYNRIHGIPPM